MTRCGVFGAQIALPHSPHPLPKGEGVKPVPSLGHLATRPLGHFFFSFLRHTLHPHPGGATLELGVQLRDLVIECLKLVDHVVALHSGVGQ